jgi:hypothetical protein
MYETRNETNRLSVTSGEETDPSDLIFRLLSGEPSRNSRRQTKTEYELRIRRKSMSVTVAARSLFPARNQACRSALDVDQRRGPKDAAISRDAVVWLAVRWTHCPESPTIMMRRCGGPVRSMTISGVATLEPTSVQWSGRVSTNDLPWTSPAGCDGESVTQPLGTVHRSGLTE